MAVPLRHARPVPLRKRDVPAWAAWSAVGALTVTSLVLGFFDLTKRSLWLDEGYTWLTSTQRVHVITQISRQQGYHLLPYYLLIHLMTSWFGASAFVMRAPSVVAGALAVPFLYLLVCRLGGRLAGIYAALLFVVSEPLVFWQQNARDYSLVVLFAVASTLAAVVAMQEERLWLLLVWAAVTGLGCYTHPEMLLLLPPQILVMLIWTPSWRACLAMIGLTAVGALLSLPVLGEAAHSNVYQLTFLSPPNHDSATEIATFLASATGSSAPVGAANHALLGIMFGIVVVGVGILGADLVDRGCTAANLGLGLSSAWLVVPPVLAWMAAETGHPDFLDRYVVLCLPAAAAVVALVMVRLTPRGLGAFLVVYLIIFRAGFLVQSYHWPVDDYRGATATILSMSQPDDCITFSSNGGRLLWDYYSARMHAAGRPKPYVPAQVLPLARNGPPSVVLSFENLSVAQIDYSQRPLVVAIASTVCRRIFLLQSHAGSATGSAQNRQLAQSLSTLEANLRAYYQPATQVALGDVPVILWDRVRVAPVRHH